MGVRSIEIILKPWAVKGWMLSRVGFTSLIDRCITLRHAGLISPVSILLYSNAYGSTAGKRLNRSNSVKFKNKPLRIPPNQRTTAAGRKVLRVDNDPTADYVPYPPMSGLLNIPLETIMDIKSFFPTLEVALNFFDRVKNVMGFPVSVIKSNHVNSKPFTVVIKMQISKEHVLDTYQDIDECIGVGRSMKLRGALNLAKLDLSERLVRMLSESNRLLSTNAKASLKKNGIEFVSVEMDKAVRDRIAETCKMLNETGVFQSLPISASMSQQSIANSFEFHGGLSYKFKSLSPHIIESLNAPNRETSKLPIWQLFHEIVRCIELNNVTVLSAATGSGKTTQIPQFILDYYLQTKKYHDRSPSVLVTQPRRIAAKTVAHRVANERESMSSGSGQAVGYAVRFDSKPPVYTRDGSILFCTAGILLRRLQREPDLHTITHLILDEVHERDVFTDILLLATRKILKMRPDLRVILMSATMEAEKFVSYFREKGFSVGTVLNIEGTNHLVKELFLDDVIKFLPINTLSETTKDYIQAELGSDESKAVSDLIISNPMLRDIPYDLLCSLIQHVALKSPEGAILVFLPGWEEITEMYQSLCTKLSGESVEYHLLHSTSPIGTADAAFRCSAKGIRKIILATNIAESSVTIPDVVYVIDSGKQKVMHYDQKLRMNVLEPCWISKANLRQRLGRAGRCQPGEYYGLYSKSRSRRLPDQTIPELLRLGLDEVCLNLKAMGLTQPAVKTLAMAIDAPQRHAIRSAIDRLLSLGAIDGDEQLTPLGKALANLSLHPGILLIEL